MMSDNRLPRSEREAVERLFHRNGDLREGQAIVDWLEMNARESLDEAFNRSDIFGDSLLGWENTLHCLQMNKVKPGLVTELDPDAKLRQGKLLHDLDEQDQQRLTKVRNSILGIELIHR